MKKNLIMILAMSLASGSVIAQPTTKTKPKFDCSTVQFLSTQIYMSHLQGKPSSVWYNLVEDSKTNPRNPDVNRVEFAAFMKNVVKEVYATNIPTASASNAQKAYTDLGTKVVKAQIAKCQAHNNS